MRDASFNRQGRPDFEAPKVTASPRDKVKYMVWGLDALTVGFLVYIVCGAFSYWFLPTFLSSDFMWDLMILCPILVILAGIPFTSVLLDYFESRPLHSIGTDFGPKGNMLARAVQAGIVLPMYGVFILPHASTFIIGQTTVKTFNVEWHVGKGRQCTGYRIVDYPTLADKKLCRRSQSLRPIIGESGTLDMRGVENALGFRVAEVVTTAE